MFTVNGDHWQIVKVRPDDYRLMRTDGVQTLGATDINRKEVYLSDDLKDYMLQKVLTHELVHVFCLSYDYEMDIRTEEIVADFLSLYGSRVLEVAEDVLKQLAVLG